MRSLRLNQIINQIKLLPQSWKNVKIVHFEESLISALLMITVLSNFSFISIYPTNFTT